VSQKEHYTVAGHKIALDKKTVEHKLAAIKAQEINEVYVTVGEKRFPVNQVLAEATGLFKSQFTTRDAVRVLEGAGFKAKRKKKKEEDQ
jgi:5-methylcytosine-specific restriction protein B